jgi:signal transduction histidine kinase
VLDLTERKRAEADRIKLEERLRQAEKMEAIGRFASGIAHDFNNVLGGILAYGEMLVDEAPENTTRKRYAQNVLTAATRGRDLVDQILAYTRTQRGEHVPTNICRMVVETLELVRSSLPARITLHATIPDQPLVVTGNATQIHQVVMNLCTNSIHAMKAGGPLRVAITPLDVFEDCALSHGTLRPAGYARVSVEDGGCGMDDATLSRIFEPFFTTKEVGRGTGLGLALVYAIVTDFGGAIDVKSTPDEGSTFAIYIPLADVRDVAIVA